MRTVDLTCRFEGNKRKRDLEAATPLWRIDLEIKQGEVYWWTESEAQALYTQVATPTYPASD